MVNDCTRECLAHRARKREGQPITAGHQAVEPHALVPGKPRPDQVGMGRLEEAVTGWLFQWGEAG